MKRIVFFFIIIFISLSGVNFLINLVKYIQEKLDTGSANPEIEVNVNFNKEKKISDIKEFLDIFYGNYYDIKKFLDGNSQTFEIGTIASLTIGQPIKIRENKIEINGGETKKNVKIKTFSKFGNVLNIKLISKTGQEKKGNSSISLKKILSEYYKKIYIKTDNNYIIDIDLNNLSGQDKEYLKEFLSAYNYLSYKYHLY